jgi:hypothetical protein
VNDANRHVTPGVDPQLCNCGVWPERHFSARRNGDLDANVSTDAEVMANFEGSAWQSEKHSSIAQRRL